MKRSRSPPLTAAPSSVPQSRTCTTRTSPSAAVVCPATKSAAVVCPATKSAVGKQNTHVNAGVSAKAGEAVKRNKYWG
jgi:hypothetical protein